MTLPREDRTWTQGKIKRLFAIKHNGLHYCWSWTDEVPGRGVPFFPELAGLCVVKCFSHENNWLMWCVVWINPTHLCFRLMSTSTRLLFKRASGGFEDLTELIAWCRNIFIPTPLHRFLSQTLLKKSGNCRLRSCSHIQLGETKRCLLSTNTVLEDGKYFKYIFSIQGDCVQQMNACIKQSRTITLQET